MSDTNQYAALNSSAADPSLPAELLSLALGLLQASKTADVETVRILLDKGAPAWYQDLELGWSCLHYAAERREHEMMQVLLQGGAVWNAVDKWGRTAGEISLSLGDRQGWEMIRNEGIRSEMLHHAMKGAGDDDATMTLRAEDTTSAGDNLTFLKSKLVWDMGDDGKERVLDADGNGVMMGWEEPLMKEHVRLMTEQHPDAQEGGSGISVLNVGYGLGIEVDRIFQDAAGPSRPKPIHHTIIEAHPQVLEHMRQQGVDKLPGIRILEGRWQDWLLDPEKVGQVLEGTPDSAGFDAIFVDTFAEGYEDLKAFFEILLDILEPQNGVFSFWNGLGATSMFPHWIYPTIYSVAAALAELHLEDVGLNVEWHDVPIAESLREEVWKGVKRRYWELPSYRLPIARMGL